MEVLDSSEELCCVVLCKKEQLIKKPEVVLHDWSETERVFHAAGVSLHDPFRIIV